MRPVSPPDPKGIDVGHARPKLVLDRPELLWRSSGASHECFRVEDGLLSLDRACFTKSDDVRDEPCVGIAPPAPIDFVQLDGPVDEIKMEEGIPIGIEEGLDGSQNHRRMGNGEHLDVDVARSGQRRNYLE